MPGSKKFIQKELWYWGFLAPCLIALTLVVFVPFLTGIYYSMTDWNGINEPVFKGLINFHKLAGEDLFWNSLIFTAKFAAALIIIVNLLGLGLAMLVTRLIPGKNLMRTVFYMPNLIGGIILGFIWQFIFVNVFEAMGDAIGVEWLKGWLSTTETGFWGLVIITAWQMVGYVMVIYVAYIESVPADLLEAADIDGITPVQKFIRIIFPLIYPAFTVSLFITLSNAFKLFDQNLTLTRGAPGNTTQMVALNIYQTAYSENKMALGQAKAVVLFVIVAVISIIQVYYNKKKEVEQ